MPLVQGRRQRFDLPGTGGVIEPGQFENLGLFDSFEKERDGEI